MPGWHLMTNCSTFFCIILLSVLCMFSFFSLLMHLFIYTILKKETFLQYLTIFHVVSYSLEISNKKLRLSSCYQHHHHQPTITTNHHTPLILIENMTTSNKCPHKIVYKNTQKNIYLHINIHRYIHWKPLK